MSRDRFPNEAIKYYGHNPTGTEKESGEEIHKSRGGPLKRDGLGHRMLLAHAYGSGWWTAYEASRRAARDGEGPHGLRRESERLLQRGFLYKDGTRSNRGVTPRGRERVDAFRVSATGEMELRRLAAL